jgi:sugar fermentation stimulation protein A
MNNLHPPIQELPPTCVTFPPLIHARFLRRDNRFRVQVQLEDCTAAAYLANPGRLAELLVEGRDLWLTPARGPHRKTDYNVTLVRHPNALVSLNSHLPNRLIREALLAHRLPGYGTAYAVDHEVPLGQSRLDLCLRYDEGNPWWIEIKSVTLVEGTTAAFPDAPTQRGRRHVMELLQAVEQGARSSVIFVVQRDDARAFTPHDATDPAFGAALRTAAEAGVNVRAVRCTVTPEQICLDHEIPVCLDAPPR